MQELKDHIKTSILESALQEFLTNGYDGASMRLIALKAGITHGNIYRYFKNKRELYNSVTKEAKNDLFTVLESILKPLPAGSSEAQMEDIINKFAVLIGRYGSSLLALLDKGPEDETLLIRKKLIGMLTSYFQAHTVLGKDTEDTFFVGLSSTIVFEGFLEIIRQNKDYEWARHNLRLLINYHLFGLAHFHS